MAMRRLATAKMRTKALMQNDIADADRDTKNRPRKKMTNCSNVLVNPEISNRRL